MTAVIRFADGTKRRLTVKEPPPNRIHFPSRNLRVRYYGENDVMGYYDEYGRFVWVDEQGDPTDQFIVRATELVGYRFDVPVYEEVAE